MRPSRPLLAVLVVVAGVTVTWLVVVAGQTGQPGPPGNRAAPAGPDDGPALAALHAWDAGRARAWARGDVAALRSLYTTGSAAGERDASMLRRWRDRGLRVEGMTTQVLAAEVVDRSADRLVLVVTDRLARAVAAGHGRRIVLPDDGVTTRRMTLRLLGGAWRVSSVLPFEGHRSAVASTASTSASRNR